MRKRIVLWSAALLLGGCAAPSPREAWVAELGQANRTLGEALEYSPADAEREALLADFIKQNPKFIVFQEIKPLAKDPSANEVERYLRDVNAACQTCSAASGMPFFSDPLITLYLEGIGPEHLEIMKKIADEEQNNRAIRLFRGETPLWFPLQQMIPRYVKQLTDKRFLELLAKDPDWAVQLHQLTPECREAALPELRRILLERNDYNPLYFEHIAASLLDTQETMEQFRLAAIRKPGLAFLLPVLENSGSREFEKLLAEAWETQKALPDGERIKGVMTFARNGNREALEYALNFCEREEFFRWLLPLSWTLSPRMTKEETNLKAYYEKYRGDWRFDPTRKIYERPEVKKENSK